MRAEAQQAAWAAEQATCPSQSQGQVPLKCLWAAQFPAPPCTSGKTIDQDNPKPLTSVWSHPELWPSPQVTPEHWAHLPLHGHMAEHGGQPANPAEQQTLAPIPEDLDIPGCPAHWEEKPQTHTCAHTCCHSIQHLLCARQGKSALRQMPGSHPAKVVLCMHCDKSCQENHTGRGLPVVC